MKSVTDCKDFQFKDHPIAKNAQSLAKIFHEVLLLMKFLQPKHQVKNMNINYYDFHDTSIKNLTNVEKNENLDKSIQAFYTK